MADRPIIFSAPMIKALLSGSKTQTRRIIKPQPTPEAVVDGSFIARANSLITPKPIPWAVGQRLWVRENAYFAPNMCAYAADNEPLRPGERVQGFGRMRPSIHMPRWASRLTLIVENVCIEQLQDISEEGALAEGVEATEFWRDEHPPSICFSVLWDSINADRAPWASNPWICVLTFRVIKANIDTVEEHEAA